MGIPTSAEGRFRALKIRNLLSTGDRFHDAMKREIGLGDCLMYVNIYRYVYLCTVYITWQNIERVFPKEPFSLRNAWRNRKCFAILLLGPWTTTKLSHFYPTRPSSPQNKVKRNKNNPGNSRLFFCHHFVFPKSEWTFLFFPPMNRSWFFLPGSKSHEPSPPTCCRKASSLDTCPARFHSKRATANDQHA